MHARLLALLMLSPLAACGASQGEPAGPSVPTATVETPLEALPAAESARRSAQDVMAGLKAGVPYYAVRAKLESGGWLPIQDGACADNMGGGAQAALCSALPELEACSGDGRCVMNFGDAEAARRLRLDTEGDISRWQESGNPPALAVRSWTLRDIADRPRATCPAATFAGFLEAFASSPAVRSTFSAPLIKVARVGEAGVEEFAYTAWVASDGYDGFRLRHAAGAFHVVDADGHQDPDVTPVQVRPTADGYDVSYRYGMSEGGIYRFLASDGCWTLAEEPLTIDP